MTSFEEIKAERKLLREGNIQVVENPRFMTGKNGRRWSGGRRDRRREEPTPTLVKQNRNFSLFPYPHHRRGQLKAVS